MIFWKWKLFRACAARAAKFSDFLDLNSAWGWIGHQGIWNCCYSCCMFGGGSHWGCGWSTPGGPGCCSSILRGSPILYNVCTVHVLSSRARMIYFMLCGFTVRIICWRIFSKQATRITVTPDRQYSARFRKSINHFTSLPKRLVPIFYLYSWKTNICLSISATHTSPFYTVEIILKSNLMEVKI